MYYIILYYAAQFFLYQECNHSLIHSIHLPSIRVVVYKNGIRTTEFFRDHDKLRSGIITENQVGGCHCALAQCMSSRTRVLEIITPCACAAGGRVIGLCLSVCPQSKRCLSSEGLIEGLFQDRSVRIQKILAST